MTKFRSPPSSRLDRRSVSLRARVIRISLSVRLPRSRIAATTGIVVGCACRSRRSGRNAIAFKPAQRAEFPFAVFDFLDQVRNPEHRCQSQRDQNRNCHVGHHTPRDIRSNRRAHGRGTEPHRYRMWSLVVGR